jgi:hypothetical protein
MRIVLDRRNCQCWDPACEAHFGWHFLRGEVNPLDCTVEISDDGKPERTFCIMDRDGVEKLLVVDDLNQVEAYDSWMQVLEQQSRQRQA